MKTRAAANQREVLTPGFRRKPKTIIDKASQANGEQVGEEYYVERHEAHESIERRRQVAEEQEVKRRNAK